MAGSFLTSPTDWIGAEHADFDLPTTLFDLDLSDLSFAHTEILLEHGGIGDLKVDNVMFSFLPRGNLYCGYGSAWRETKRNDRCRVAVAF